MTIRIKGIETYAGLCFLLLTVAIYFVSAGFPDARGSGSGPAFFPRVVAACIAVLGIVQIARDRFLAEDRVHELSGETVKRVLAPLLLTVAYVWAMPHTGFLLGTIVFLVVFLWYSGVTAPKIVFPYSIGITVALQYVFGSFLHIPLPDGVVPVVDFLPLLSFVVEVSL